MSLLGVHGLTKRFAGLVAVNDVSFEAPVNMISALIGPNGAGKTTCFNLIAGAMAPTSGRVVFDGVDVTGHAPEALCRLGVARTFQIVRPLAGLSVIENAIVGALARTESLKEARQVAMATLERVGLAGKADAPATELTLPDRKLLELAKALATRPRLLMLDEVMAGLRPTEAERIIALLRGIVRDGVTILLVEHVMRIVMALADKVIVLHHGEKIADGAPGEVAADPRVVESYLGRKAKPA